MAISPTGTFILRTLLILGISALALQPALALGSTLPNACLTYNADTQTNNGGGVSAVCGAAGTYTDTFQDRVDTVVLSTSTSPAVSATITLSSSGRWPSEADARIEYYIEFSGPTATVPIQVNAVASAFGPLSQAQLAIGNQGLSSYYLYLVASTSGPFLESDGILPPCSANTVTPLGGGQSCGASYVPGTPVSNDLTWIANTNVVYEVQLEAVADAAGPGTVGTASVDPTFSIAPSVTDPQDYSILLSDGIGNSAASTAAPEPASWICGGMGGILLIGSHFVAARFSKRVGHKSL